MCDDVCGCGCGCVRVSCVFVCVHVCVRVWKTGDEGVGYMCVGTGWVWLGVPVGRNTCGELEGSV